jgi:hypothetical protein
VLDCVALYEVVMITLKKPWPDCAFGVGLAVLSLHSKSEAQQRDARASRRHA